MVNPVEVLRSLEADAAIDGATVRRGYDYADRGRVMRVELDHHDDGLEIVAVVAGSRIYHVVITGRSHPVHGVEVDTSCSCPMAYDCKHVVAAAVRAAVRDGHRSPQDWRRLLDDVLDEAPVRPARSTADEPTPVGVQVVVPTNPVRGRYAATRAAATLRPRLGFRAVRLGSSGRWVKAGMGWNLLAGLRSDDAGRIHPAPDALDVLLELRAALIGRRGYLSTVDDAIDVHDAGPALWTVLGKLGAAGVALLCSDAEIEPAVADQPVELALDLRGTPEAVVLRPGARDEQRWYDTGDLSFIGEPAHGVALWEGGPGRPGSRLLLAPVVRAPSRTVRGWFGSHEPLTVPRAELDELLTDYLPRIAGTLPVGSRDGSVALPGEAEVTLRCAVTWDDAGEVDLDWRWRYRYDEVEEQFPTDDPQIRGRRDLGVERALLDRIEPSEELADLMAIDLTGPGTVVGHRRLRQVEAMRFARELLPQLLSRPGVEVVTNGEPPVFREITAVPEIRFAGATEAHRRDRTDWLDLDVVVTVSDPQLGTVQLDLPRVLAALASGETTIMVHRGVYCDIDRPEFDRLSRLVHDARALSDQPRRGLRVSRQAHALLAEIDEIGPTEGQLRDWSQASAALRRLAESGDALPQEALPAQLTATLRPYQHDGYQWLSFLHGYGLGGILADDMGLGKTVQTLAMIAGAVERAGTGHEGSGRAPFLVVAPSSVVGTWRSQAAAFTPELSVVTITESMARRGWSVGRALDADCPVDVVVTTYTLLRLEIDQYEPITWAGVVIDEAQTVKNHRSKTYAAIRGLDARSRFAITGTPIENNLMELWALLALTAPGLFPHAAAFGDQFAKPIEQEADTGALATLRQRVRPVMLRRTKDLVATDLPPKQQQVLSVELSPAHRRVYDTHLQRERQRILELLDDLDENRISVLASLTRLRQLSLDPALVDPVHDRIGSAKIDQLLERVVELSAEGHRALVFSQFTGFLSRVRDRLRAAGIGHVYLDGSTTDRTRVIDSFRDGDAPVFLISLKAGGVGLTLVEADYCFLLDPWWNPAVEAQAIDRTHRIGQTRPVMVYRLVAADTIEEKVVALAERKAELYRSVLDDAGDGFGRQLGAEDIKALLAR